jgi:hypothetical protein
MSIAFSQDAKVRFTQERLSMLTPRDRQGLAGRIGIVQVDKNSTRKPTVYFPVDGTKLELRLFRVDPRHLELVEMPPTTEITPQLADGVNHAALTLGNADVATSEPDGGGTLTQSEMDNLFN